MRKVGLLKGTINKVSVKNGSAVDREELTRATPPATIKPRAETPLAEAAPVANGIGLPVGVGGTATPVEATVGEATPDVAGLLLGQAMTVTIL
jgi:hypothetical protein